MKKKVALLFGGRSLEHDVSIITAMQILSNIDTKKYVVEPIYMADGKFLSGNVNSLKFFKNFEQYNHTTVMLIAGEFYEIHKNRIKKFFKPDIAIIACHGGEGENGTLQALLDYNGIPYSSPDVLSSAVCMDKDFCKQVFESMGLNVLPYQTVYLDEYRSDDEKVIFAVESFLSYPLIVKPARLGSSIGVGVAKNRAELKEKLAAAFAFDDKVVVENKLEDFVEVNCAAFYDGNVLRVSKTETPISVNEFLTFQDKYEQGGKMSELTRISPAKIGSLNLIVQAITERVYKDFDMNGIVRVDFLVDEKRNKVYINEINTVPGSFAFYLFDMDFETLIDLVVEASIKRKLKCSRKASFKTNIIAKFEGGLKTHK